MTARLHLSAVLLFAAFAAAAAQIAPLPYTAVPPPEPEATRSATPAPNAPTAILRGFSLSGEDAATLRQAPALTLDPGYPDLVLFFDALPATPAPEFRYRLTGFDPDYTLTRDRHAHYRRLPPGRFVFELQAHTPGEPWSTALATLPVYQQPFFYQTWYFYLLLALSLIALAIQLLRQRDQLLKGQMGIVMEERNRIASDCHDTLMAGFAAISWQLEATANLFRDAHATTTPAAQSCELARSMVAHCQAEARRIIWDLRESNELTNILSQALSRAIGAHRLRGTVETTFDVEGDEIALAPVAVHHLVCIGQEAVTNAILHAACTTIRVRLHFHAEALTLTVTDDGHGFLLATAARRVGHFGIPVMEERTRKLGGAFRLTSTLQKGTEVAVTVSFQSIHHAANQQHHVVPWIGV